MAIAHKELGMLIWHDTDLSDPLSTGQTLQSLHFPNLNLLCYAVKLSEARKHAELSLSILGRHLPAQHFLLAFSKNILALILEEIADISQVGLVTSNILNSDRTACRTRLQWSRC